MTTRKMRASLLAGTAVLAATTASAVVVGVLSPRFDDSLRGGGVVVQGASLAGREDSITNSSASITISGIPPGATVQRALLYWVISGGSDTTATINAVAVTGASIGATGDTCWGANNASFRADVTSRVTGNGTYTIAGLPSTTSPSGTDTDGVALVVVYQDPGSAFVRRVMIRDGGISTNAFGDVVNDTFAGVSAPISSAARFHLVVGDGQTIDDAGLEFNGASLGADQFPGSDGSLWDANTYNVSVPGALANAPWRHTSGTDCLVFEAAVLEWDVAQCGDSLITSIEQCDDGGVIGGDGCDAQCNESAGWDCTGQPSVCVLVVDDIFDDGFEGASR